MTASSVGSTVELVGRQSVARKARSDAEANADRERECETISLPL
jgi:hypothetical protein